MFTVLSTFQMDVRGVLQQVPCSAAGAPAPGAGPDLVPSYSPPAHPRSRPVLLRKDQSIFPGRPGGSPGEAESREPPSSCRDHPEPGQRMAGTGQLR